MITPLKGPLARGKSVKPVGPWLPFRQRYHPARAYAWELRLQDEIRPDFTLDEAGSDEARARFLAEHPEQAAEILARELRRRERRTERGGVDEEGTSG